MAILYLLFKGMSLGFSIAAPIGPIGVLCIRRTLQKGKASGFISGLGASSASFLYGITLIFGFSLFPQLLEKAEFWLRLFGGLFLILLGVRILRSKLVMKGEGKITATLLQDYASTFLLNLTNPITLISYFAVFSSYGTLEGITSITPFFLIGIFLGSASWWAILSNLTSFFKTRLDNRLLLLVNTLAGTAIIGFGVFSLPLLKI